MLTKTIGYMETCLRNELAAKADVRAEADRVIEADPTRRQPQLLGGQHGQ